MIKIFILLLRVDLAASAVVLLVMLARWCLRRQPKRYSYALWGLVLARLLCPFFIEAPVAMPAMPELFAEYGQVERAEDSRKTAGQRVSHLPDSESGEISVYLPEARNFPPDEQPQEEGEDRPAVFLSVLSAIWAVGAAVMLGRFVLSYRSLYSRLKVSSHIKENIYESPDIKTAFVLGLLKPKIYLPEGLSSGQYKNMLLHEKTHIRRLDHVVKSLSYVLLCLHWFNPLMWCSYRLMCADMERSCDEAVINKLLGQGHSLEHVKRSYGGMLLELAESSVEEKVLSFAGASARERMENIMKFRTDSRRPAAFLLIFALLVTLSSCAYVSAGTQQAVSEGEKVSSTEVSGFQDALPYDMIRYQVTRDDLFYVGPNDMDSSNWAYIDSKGLTCVYSTRDGCTKNSETIRTLYEYLDYSRYEFLGEGSYGVLETSLDTNSDYPSWLCVTFENADDDCFTEIQLDGKGNMLRVDYERSGEAYDEDMREYLEYRAQGLPTHYPDPYPSTPLYYKAPAELYGRVSEILLKLPQSRRNETPKIINGVNGYIAEDGAIIYQYNIESELISEIIVYSELRVISETSGCNFVIKRYSDEFQNIIYPAFFELYCIEPVPPREDIEQTDAHPLYLYADDYYGTPEQEDHVITIFGDTGYVKVHLNGQTEWYYGGDAMSDYCRRIAALGADRQE